MDEVRKSLPDNLWFIFEGIEEDFDKSWELHDEGNWKSKTAKWNGLVDWLTRYTELYRSIIPKNHVRCLIQTRQQYEDFTAEEIRHTLKTLGELANHLYIAWRDQLTTCSLYPKNYYPLRKYYIYALESVVNMVATFTQDYQHFTDLVTRLTELE